MGLAVNSEHAPSRLVSATANSSSHGYVCILELAKRWQPAHIDANRVQLDAGGSAVSGGTLH